MAVLSDAARRRAQAASWPTITFIDGMLSSFILPFGPLLIMSFSDTSAVYDDGVDSDRTVRAGLSSWETVAQLWSQLYAAFLVGRAAGKILGSWVSRRRLAPDALLACGLGGIVATQLWLGLTVTAGGRMLTARAVGGIFSGALCSAALSGNFYSSHPKFSPYSHLATAYKRRSSRYSTHNDDDGEFVGGSGQLAMAALRRADAWWHFGLVLGPVMGGALYGRSMGWRWLASRPALLACVAACSCMAGMAAYRSAGFRSASYSVICRCFRNGLQIAKRGFGCRRRDNTGASSLGAYAEEESEMLLLFGDEASLHASRSGYSFARDSRTRGLLEELELKGDPRRQIDLEASGGVGGAEAGAGASGPTANGPVSARYIKVCGDNETEARKMWEATVKWRAETGANKSLSTPQPTLMAIKGCYPYFVHGRSKKGEVVVYEQTGKMKFGELAKLGVTPFDMQMHYAFFNDFVFSKLLPADDAQLMTVLDVGELSMSTLKNNTVVTKYLAATAEVMQKHYPDRQSRILVVNAPWWFAGIWKTVSGMLSSGTTAKLQIRGTNFLPTLLEHVDASQIPPEYGGCSPFKLGYSPEECALQDLATSLGSTTLQTTTATANINNNNRNNNTGLSAHTRPPHTPSHLHFSAVTAHAEHSEDVADGRAGGGAPAEGGGGMREEEGGARDMPAGSATGVRDTDAEKGGVLDSGRGGLWGFRSRDSSSISSGGETGRPVIAARVSGRGGGGENGQGVKQRLASVVRRMGGGMRGGVRATEAYLGVENKFRYDSERRMWVMDGEDGEGRRGSGDGFAGGRWGANDGERDLEDGSLTDSDSSEGSERRLVRAIQASQRVRGGGFSTAFSSGVGGDGAGYGNGDGGARVVAGTWRMDGPPPVHGGGEESSGAVAAAAIVFGLHMTWAALETGMEAVLLMWMLFPGDGGRLRLTAAQTGMALSIALAVLAVPRYWASAAIVRMTAQSPVRILRAAAVVQVVVAMFLSGVATSSWTISGKRSGSLFAAVTIAISTARAAGMLARPALVNLLGVALGYGNGYSGVDGVHGLSGGDGYYRRRPGVRIAMAAAIGVSKAIGVLTVGGTFARAGNAEVDGGVVCFRLCAVGFLGIYFATMFVHTTDGTGGGGGAGWRSGGAAGGGGGAWLCLCDFVEEAIPVHAGVGGGVGAAGGGSDWGLGSTVKES